MTDVRSPQRRGDSSEESRKERIDRELMELLNELRVALPGVQFLFAFLLVVLLVQRPLYSGAGLGIVALGLPVYLLWRRFARA